MSADGMLSEADVGAAAPKPAPAAAPAKAAPAPKPAAKAAPAPAADPAPVTEEAPATKEAKAPVAKDAPAKPASEAVSIFDDDDEPAEGEAVADGETAETEAAAEEKSEPASWPDDWRERIAGTDEKMLTELKRFSSFDNWVKSQRALRQKLATGEYKKAETFDESWDDTKKAAWRKEQGVPEKPDGYTVPEVAGHAWSDEDKAALAPMFEDMHALNAKPEVVQAALGHYANVLAAAKEKITANDRQHKIELEDHLRTEWGPDYRANVNLMKRALNDPEVLPGGMADGGLGAALMTARLADGRRLINMPGMADFLANIAREKYGESAMLPSSEVTALNSREAEITKIMETDIDRYYRERNANGETLQQELAAIMARKSGGGGRNARAA